MILFTSDWNNNNNNITADGRQTFGTLKVGKNSVCLWKCLFDG